MGVLNKTLEKKGIAEGTKLVSINGFKVEDQFDVNFYSDENTLTLEFIDKNGRAGKTKIPTELISYIEFEPLKPKRCGARCIFCFIEQLPKGLRKTLYHKDEDYRFSYLYGNYVAFANVTESDLRKIVLYRLSPLYISVHTTDPVLRGKMLGLKKAAPILPYIEFLTRNRIVLHCQIVLCPGVNDEKVLEKTIKELSGFYPYLSSVAVVPVGLTSHRQGLFSLRSFDRKGADTVIKQITSYQKEFIKKMKTPFVFLADEFYLLAGKKPPEAEHYQDFSQIENGVGITRKVYDDAESFLKKGNIGKTAFAKSIAVVTGTLAYRYLLPYVRAFNKKTGFRVNLYSLENKLFGKTVTVAGLLSGKDVMEGLKDKSFDILFIPDVMLRDKKNTFLDDVTVQDLRRYFQKKVYTFTPLFSQLYKKIKLLEKSYGETNR